MKRKMRIFFSLKYILLFYIISFKFNALHPMISQSHYAIPKVRFFKYSKIVVDSCFYYFFQRKFLVLGIGGSQRSQIRKKRWMVWWRALFWWKIIFFLRKPSLLSCIFLLIWSRNLAQYLPFKLFGPWEDSHLIIFP